MIAFRPKITVPNGRFLSAKNAPFITARSTRATDKSGNSLPSPIERYRNDPPYFCRWTIKKEAKGFIFREVENGSGICGHHATVRELVINSSRFDYIVVEYDNDKSVAEYVDSYLKKSKGGAS